MEMVLGFFVFIFGIREGDEGTTVENKERG